jgi:hypothetical protein
MANNGDDATAYGPISRKYLRYLIEGLNQDDSGPGIFAQLAARLIHRRKCANIVPATEPSRRGDYGQDARNQPVLLDSDGRFRLYESPPIVEERWIFAFSIRVDWEAKLRSDVDKIIANNLKPERIIFVTNQFISPERVKIDTERKIEETYGVPCEILDGQWILDQLYEQDYVLAVEFLGCPPEEDPELMKMFRRVYGLKEGGLSEDEALELEQLKSQVQYRNRYTETPEHLVQDLRRIGDILAPYEAHLEEAIAWYEEALPELDRLIYLPDGIELSYAYFKTLFKLPNGPSKIFELLPRFIDLVFTSQAPSLYRYVPTWLNYLLPHFRGQDQFDQLYQATLARFRALDRSDMGQLSQAYLDEAILNLEPFAVREQDPDLKGWLDKVYAFLQRVSDISAFPLDRVATALGVLAPRLAANPDYEACFELALELNSKQAGDFSKGDTLRRRALAHAKAGQLHDAIIMASRAKILWFNERSIRGFLISAVVLSEWYRQLGYLQAAEYELIEGIHLTTWQPSYMHPDLLVGMIVVLAKLAFLQGRVLRAYRWLLYYYRLCHQYRLEPDADVTYHMLERNLGLLMARLFSRNRSVYDRLLELADQLDPNLLLSHREIILSSDEEFELWLEDLPSDEQALCRDLRRRVHAGEVEPPDNVYVGSAKSEIDETDSPAEQQAQGQVLVDQLGREEPELIGQWVDYDELAREQYIEWQMPILYLDALTIRVSYPRHPELAQLAFTFSAMFQIWSVFLYREIGQLTFAFDHIYVAFEWLIRGPESLVIGVESREEDLHLTLSVTRRYIERVADRSSEGTVDFLIKAVGSVIEMIVLDNPQEVAALFDSDKSGEVVDRLFTVASPAYLCQTNWVKTVWAVDNAT